MHIVLYISNSIRCIARIINHNYLLFSCNASRYVDTYQNVIVVQFLPYRKEGGDNYIKWAMEPVMTSVDKQPKANVLNIFRGLPREHNQRKHFWRCFSYLYYGDNQLNCGADQSFCFAKRKNT